MGKETVENETLKIIQTLTLRNLDSVTILSWLIRNPKRLEAWQKFTAQNTFEKTDRYETETPQKHPEYILLGPYNVPLFVQDNLSDLDGGYFIFSPDNWEKGEPSAYSNMFGEILLPNGERDPRFENFIIPGEFLKFSFPEFDGVESYIDLQQDLIYFIPVYNLDSGHDGTFQKSGPEDIFIKEYPTIWDFFNKIQPRDLVSLAQNQVPAYRKIDHKTLLESFEELIKSNMVAYQYDPDFLKKGAKKEKNDES